MSKNKNLKENKKISESEQTENVVAENQTLSNTTLPAKEDKTVKIEKTNTAKQDKKKKEKKPKERKISKKAREMSSELKKVTWPGFAEVCKKTGIVLVVVLVFALLLFGLDTLFGYLFGLLTG